MLRNLLFVAGAALVVANRKKIVETAKNAAKYVKLLQKSPIQRELLLRDVRAPFQRTFSTEEMLAEIATRFFPAGDHAQTQLKRDILAGAVAGKSGQELVDLAVERLREQLTSDADVATENPDKA